MEWYGWVAIAVLFLYVGEIERKVRKLRRRTKALEEEARESRREA